MRRIWASEVREHAKLWDGSRGGGTSSGGYPSGKEVPMKWTVRLVAETATGELVEQQVGQIEREELITPASLGLSIAEGKAILAKIQHRMVTEQVRQHG